MRATQGRQVRKALGLLLVLLACCAASDVSPPRPQGFGIGDYEYNYDELYHPHLGRARRDAADHEDQAVEAYKQAAEALKQQPEAAPKPGPEAPKQQPQQEHVQHVPANTPRAPKAADTDSVIQRVPGPQQAAAAVPPVPAEPAVPAAAAVPAVPAAAAAAVPAAVPVPEPVPAAAHQDQAPAPAAPQPAAGVQGLPEVAEKEQAPEVVPAAVPESKLAEDGKQTKDAKEPKEDMETSNFFWGLGPVYPHLYVYRRVPHLVPLHGWSPYHAYYITHPSAK